MSWELFVGLRYLRSRRNETFVSVITVIATLGVLVGVLVLTVTLSIMGGFEQDLRARILGLHPHLRVSKPVGMGLVEDPAELEARVAADPRIVSVTPVVQSQLLISAGDYMVGVFARGVDPQHSGSVAGISEYVKAGHIDDLDARLDVDGVSLPTVMIGRVLADKLMVEVGDTVRLMSPRLSASPLGALPRARRFAVAAIYESGMSEYDMALVYVGIDDLRLLLDLGPVATGLEARIADPYDAPAVAADLNESIGPPYWVQSWTEAHANVFAALALEKTAYFLILMLIILVAAFNIVSTLYMVVMEKRRDIAVLKTMGATNRSVAMIFVAKGMLIGTVGTVSGASIGFALCEALARWKFFDLPAGVFYVDTLPVRVVPGEFAMVAAAALAVCFGACLFPAWKASRVVPVDVLRYE
jgi:lipoprotein-releasing system permease protein